MKSGQYEGSGPGKTSPRIEQDILDYDHRQGGDLLYKPAPQFFDPKKRPNRTQPKDCRHKLWLKETQTEVDAHHAHETRDIAALFCYQCSQHFDVVVDYTQRPGRLHPCYVDTPYPLHHWQPVSRIRPDLAAEHHNHWKYNKFVELQTWACSAPNCPCVLYIMISPPRLDKGHVALLTDAKRTYARGVKVMKEDADPNRFVGSSPAEPCEVLHVLRTYLHNALHQTHSRKIAARNKRFRLAFGDDCDELLEYIGFKMVEEVDANGQRDNFWLAPDVEVAAEPAFDGVRKGTRHFVDDIYWEVSRLFVARPADELKRGKSEVTIPQPSGLTHLRLVLGCVDYERDERPVELDILEHPHYASLGAVSSFSDGLVLFAYQRQRDSDADPMNRAHYLECLQGIGNGRESSFLQEECAKLMSMGEKTRSEIEAAYRFFALNSTVDHGDEHIIGVYNSRIDAAPRHKEEARENLRTIGMSRNSKKIEDVSDSKDMTYEEALEYLGVDENTPSDSIDAAAVVKGLDDDKVRVGQALSIIGSRRGDLSLQVAGAKLEVGDGGMPSLDEAYQRLQIAQHNVPDEYVFNYYQTLMADAPAGSKASFRGALLVIAQDRKSAYLLTKMDNPDAVVAPQRSTADHPIGLDNIGNTCYLNSLLQYYYTVRVFMDVVMNFDEYKMPLDEESIRQKRVGRRAVSKAEVIKSQKFVEELRNLYMNLKSASSQSVRPTQDLAELTLLTETAEANFRRASISSPTAVRAVRGHFSPPPRPPSHSPPPVPDKDASKAEDSRGGGDDIDMVDSPTDAAQNNGDTARLDSQPQTGSASGASPVDAYKSGPQGGAVNEDHKMLNGAPPSPPSSSGQDSAQMKPPIPPRNKPTPIITPAVSDEDVRKEKLSFGAQQDVTEVIGNVLFRMSCAIKPTRIDEAFGEQIDSIRESFYGISLRHLIKGNSSEVTPEVWNNIMIYPADNGPRDIYDAIDVNYDEQMVNLSNAEIPSFASISKLPPVLHIQIQRTAFDKSAQQASKNQNHVTFDETLFMDRYMEDESILQRRRDAWRWKGRLKQLGDRLEALGPLSQANGAQMLSVSEALSGTKDFLTDLSADGMRTSPINTSLASDLEYRAAEIDEEVRLLMDERSMLCGKLKELFTGMQQHRFRLHAVFMHRGTNAYGHYWIYIYDFKTDVWREYNDERVTIVEDRKKIFEHEHAGGATPYYLAYVRDDEKETLVDAVVREIDDDVQASSPKGVALYQGDVMDEDAVEINGAQHIENYEPSLDSRRSGLEAGDQTAWKDMQAGKPSEDVAHVYT